MIAPGNNVARNYGHGLPAFRWASEGGQITINYTLDCQVGYNLILDEDSEGNRVWVTCDEVVEHVDCVSVTITRGDHEIVKFSRSSGVDQPILESFARDFMVGGKNDGSHETIIARFKSERRALLLVCD